MNNVASIYKPIYEEMRERNKNLILINGTKYDAILSSRQKDTRVGLALFAKTEFHLNENYHRMLDDAQETFSPHIVYQPILDTAKNHGLLHFTFIQFIGVDPLVEKVTPELLKKYIEVLKPVILQIPSFSLEYSGIIALATGLAMYAYPSTDINVYREKIRQEITAHKLSFKEPYKIDIAHSTFVRFTQLENRDTLLAFAEKYKNTKFGSVDITGFYLGNGSWRMLPNEVTKIHEFSLV